MDSICPGSSKVSELGPTTDFSGNENTYLHKTKRHSQVDFECLTTLYNDKLLCDVVLVAEGMEIRAHKMMLATCSAYFYWKFSKDRHLRVLDQRIEIKNLTYETLSSVIGYLYRSEIVITEKNVADLSSAAYLFALKDLLKACEDFLATNLTPKNCLRTRDIARRCQYEELVSTANDYLVSHFSEFVNHEEFLELSYEQLTHFIDADALHKSDEEEVLDFVIRWVKYDLECRKCHIYSLMENVNFLLISLKDLVAKLEAEEWLTSDSQYSPFLREVLKRHVSAPVQLLPKQEKSSQCLMIVGFTSDDDLDMEFYDLERNIPLGQLELPYIEYSDTSRTAILGTTIYCINGGPMMKFFNPSDMEQAEWADCRDIGKYGKILQGEKYDMVASNDHIFAFGGHSNNLKRFDVSNGEWAEILSMAKARWSVGLGVLRGNVYVIGGKGKSKEIRDSHRRSGGISESEEAVVNSVRCRQTRSHCWYSLPGMSTKRCNPGVTSSGDTLYVVGGATEHGPCRKVEAFNPAELYWEELPDLNVARISPGVIWVDGQLLVVGGHNQSGELESMELYNPESKTWTMLLGSMETGKRFVSVSLVDRATVELICPSDDSDSNTDLSGSSFSEES